MMSDDERNFIREEIAIADSWHRFWNRAGGSSVQGYWQGYRDSLARLLVDIPLHHDKPPAVHPHDIEPEADEDA